MRPNTTAVAAMKNRVNFPKVRLEELRVFAEERAMSAPGSDHVVCGFVASGGEGEVRLFEDAAGRGDSDRYQPTNTRGHHCHWSSPHSSSNAAILLGKNSYF